MSFAPNAAEAAIDALLQAIAKSERVAATFSAVCNGGSLTTGREPGRSLLGPSSSGPTTDPVGTRHWGELHRLGEGIFADGSLDALEPV